MVSRLSRCENHHHLAAFHLGVLLHLGEGLGVLLDAGEQGHAQMLFYLPFSRSTVSVTMPARSAASIASMTTAGKLSVIFPMVPALASRPRIAAADNMD